MVAAQNRVDNGGGVLWRPKASAKSRRGVRIRDDQPDFEEQNERLEILGRVSSSVAHDFNNVLTTILGFADLLEQDLNDSIDAKQSLEEIRTAAERGAAMVREVLDTGRSDGSEMARVQPAFVIEEMAGMLRRVLGSKMDLRIDLPAAVPEIRVDRAAFERILMNLAANARDAVRDGPMDSGTFEIRAQRVRVGASGQIAFDDLDHEGARPALPVVRWTDEGGSRVSRPLRPGRYLRLAASDDGCGVSDEARAGLFERFFTTKARGAGTGLGLSTAADRMHEWGGAIEWAESTQIPSKSGTTFHLYFPIG